MNTHRPEARTQYVLFSQQYYLQALEGFQNLYELYSPKDRDQYEWPYTSTEPVLFGQIGQKKFPVEMTTNNVDGTEYSVLEEELRAFENIFRKLGILSSELEVTTCRIRGRGYLDFDLPEIDLFFRIAPLEGSSSENSEQDEESRNLHWLKITFKGNIPGRERSWGSSRGPERPDIELIHNFPPESRVPLTSEKITLEESKAEASFIEILQVTAQIVQRVLETHNR